MNFVRSITIFISKLRQALVVIVAFTLLTGIVYPIVVTGIAHLFFSHQAHGSVIERQGRIIGSELLSQPASGPGYFHPRPSAANHDPSASAASNLSVTSQLLRETLSRRIVAVQTENRTTLAVPMDLVTASASGLDPHITVETALYQAERIAKIRKVPVAYIHELITQHTETSFPLLFGKPRVGVLELNLALDDLSAPH